MQNAKLTIIAGKYKNKKLELPSLSTTRATKSIVRGSVFDSLQFHIQDGIFVEMFGGSGSMGLEALSRGARFAYFIEQDNECCQILKRNLKAVDANAGKIFCGDSFVLASDVIKECEANNTPVFFYLDPPFSIREGQADVYDKTIALIQKLGIPNCAGIIVEHISKIDFDETIGVFTQTKSKKFGSTTLTYFEKR